MKRKNKSSSKKISMIQINKKPPLLQLNNTPSESNKCTDKMANVGCSLDYETTMFEVCSIP
jgi:hypothetical protein